MNLAGITRPGHVPMTNPGQKEQHSPKRWQNRIDIDVVGPDGTIKQKVRGVENLMVSFGLNRAAEFLATGTDAGSTFANTMAIGTSTTAAATSQDGLQASTQLAGTFSRSDAGQQTARYLGTFASDGNASEIHEVGVFGSNVATASMIARSVLGTDSINRGASDEIRVTYDMIATTA